MHFSLWKQSRCFFSVFIVNMRLSYPKQNLICLDKLLGVLSLVQQQICLFFKIRFGLETKCVRNWLHSPVLFKSMNRKQQRSRADFFFAE